MTPEAVLAEPARILSQEQRERYFEEGYLVVEGAIDPGWVAQLLSVTRDFVERSRDRTSSDGTFDLAPGHHPLAPKLRRLRRPDEQHPLYWDFATGVLADIAADLVGPDVVFHHSKLNFKWGGGEDRVEWHQDIQFYPHTNYSSLTIGTYLSDVGPDDGPLMVLPRSHEGPLFDLYGGDGAWAGCLRPEDVAALDVRTASTCPAPAGSITIHNCRTLHATAATRTLTGRPLLLNCYNSADAFPYTAVPDKSRHAGAVVRGERARMAHHDPRPCPIPPDWSDGYTSIFAAQVGEDGSG